MAAVIDFEAIYAALFALAQSIDGLTTTSRKLESWSKVPAANQPALFQVEKNYQPTQRQGLPAVWLLHAEWYLYVSGEAQDQLPSVQLNRLLKQIVEALPPTTDATQIQTLGGLVQRCWITGEIETDEGVLGSQRVAIVPIEILAA